MTLERRLRQLEASLKCQDTKYEPDISTDSIIRKLGLDPDIVRERPRQTGRALLSLPPLSWVCLTRTFKRL